MIILINIKSKLAQSTEGMRDRPTTNNPPADICNRSSVSCESKAELCRHNIANNAKLIIKKAQLFLKIIRVSHGLYMPQHFDLNFQVLEFCSMLFLLLVL